MAGVFSLFPLIFTPAGKLIIDLTVNHAYLDRRLSNQSLQLKLYTRPFGLWSSMCICLGVSMSKGILEVHPDSMFICILRFPRSLPYVILDGAEKIYMAGFPFLLAFVSVFPALLKRQQAEQSPTCRPSIGIECPKPHGSDDVGKLGAILAGMEFLPLMLTSVYCALGLVWGFLRLMFVYLHEESTYQGQLSGLG